MRRLSVAVVIPTIPPRAELLARALATVWAQTRQPDEVIVEPDPTGTGAGPTRNRAWQKATTDLVAFLDDDDELFPDHLEATVGALEQTGAQLAYSWFELNGWAQATQYRPDPLATMLNGHLVHPLGVPFGPEQAAHMRQHAFIPATVVVDRSMVAAVGGYPDPDSDEYRRCRGCEDWALLLRLLAAGARFVHVPQRTYRINLGVGTGGVSWRDQAS